MLMRPDSQFNDCFNVNSFNDWRPDACGKIIEGGVPSGGQLNLSNATHKYHGKSTLLDQNPNSFQLFYDGAKTCGAWADGDKFKCYKDTKDLSFQAPNNRTALQAACKSLQTNLGWSEAQLKKPIQLPMLIYQESNGAFAIRLWETSKDV